LKTGARRHVITIQQRTRVQDAHGINFTWATYSQPFASREFISGRETTEADGFQNIINVRFNIHYDSSVTDEMRVKDVDGNIYEITDILPDNDSGKKSLILNCVQTNSESE